ncbi:MAG: Asp-tRNA(Asn)/Glu-tRNA(Gln) amidotransferase GatCAB subunit B [Candidatus Marinimicrobia bacterium]|nr:Asp-tRNA(Asn)/Glu-tRNA(Gln) amidotransferase GatCAB subunit B [Candidatus Neomarinimicrobiota bacterium]
MSALLKRWEPVIGLEVHAQLSTTTKMFCGCRNAYGDQPNSHTCPTCLGLPGALPVANEQAVLFALKLGLAVGSEITQFSRFARKNYFYPDLTKGYQISQYDEPLCSGGSVTIRWEGRSQEIPLTRIHIEEDAGKSIHDEKGDGTRVDFNRCGVPLVEIVSEPVIRSPQEAKAYLTRLKQILEYLNICDCNMEEGNLRCDANISIRPRRETKFGVKTEMKNINSFRGVERGLMSEIFRQAEVLDGGGEVEQVTLLWNEVEQKAEVMRSKEEAHDYRYFPDPDLVPLSVSESDLEEVRSFLVELPHEREERFVTDYSLKEDDAVILASETPLSAYFEATIEAGAPASTAAKWILGEVLSIVKEEGVSMESFPASPKSLVGLLQSVIEGEVTVVTGKEVLREMVSSGLSASEIIEKEGLAQVSDASALSETVAKVLEENPDELKRYRNGKKALFGFFMGEVMKASGGKSDPKVTQKLLTEALNGID